MAKDEQHKMVLRKREEKIFWKWRIIYLLITNNYILILIYIKRNDIQYKSFKNDWFCLIDHYLYHKLMLFYFYLST